MLIKKLRELGAENCLLNEIFDTLTTSLSVEYVQERQEDEAGEAEPGDQGPGGRGWRRLHLQCGDCRRASGPGPHSDRPR